VDDEAPLRQCCRVFLETEAIQVDEVSNGPEALDILHEKPYDLVLLDVDMPVLSGAEVLQRIRAHPPVPHLKVIMLSGRVTGDEMAQMLLSGADDFLAKPFTPIQLVARVKAALSLKDSQERCDALMRQMVLANRDLEQTVQARDSDLIHARNSLTLALAELVAIRDVETGAHLRRLQRYARLLAEEASRLPAFAGQIDEYYIQMLEGSAPLHDIGKVALPDHILLKPGRYTPEERLIMQTHTTAGAAVLQKVSQAQGFAVAFLQMATDVARHHHEKFNGTGYPDRLSGSSIPLSARIVSLGDVYDALRSRRDYKTALPHDTAVQIMTDAFTTGQFDPALWEAFLNCADRFAQTFSDWQNNETPVNVSLRR
jgi:putative two-component system response regulator